MRRDGLDGNRRLRDQTSTPRVVDHDDATPRLTRCEQPSLVVEVALHVAMEVEVVALEVGEADDIELETVHPTERERMRRDLHRAGRRPALVRHSKDRLQD